MSTPQLSPVSKKPTSTVALHADPGIPLKAQASGTGGKPMSQVIPVSSSNKIGFFRVADGTALQKRLGQDTTPQVVMHRNNLVNELLKPGGADVAEVEKSLQALVAENKAGRPGKDVTKSHLYMGFGEISASDRPHASARAQALRQAATALQAQVKDPECQKMLQWISRDWAAYEKSYQSVGLPTATYRKHGSRNDASASESYGGATFSESTAKPAARSTISSPLPSVGAGTSTVEASIYESMWEDDAVSMSQAAPTSRRREKTGDAHSSAGTSTTTANQNVTTTTTTNTNTNTTTTTTGTTTAAATTWISEAALADIRKQMADETREAERDLNVPVVVLKRAGLRDALIAAVRNQDWKSFESLLGRIPREVKHYDIYFPPVRPGILSDSELDNLIDHEEEDSPTPKLAKRAACFMTYLTRGALRTDGRDRMESDQQSLSASHLDHAYGTEVRALCLLLTIQDENSLGILPNHIAQHIATALRSPLIEAELARQPYVELRRALVLCTLLEKYVAKDTVDGLRRALVSALSMQTSAPEALRARLLETDINPAEVAMAAMHQYARDMTAGSIDIGWGMPWKTIETMATNINELYKHHSANVTLAPLELLAIKWVSERLNLTLKKRPQ